MFYATFLDFIQSVCCQNHRTIECIALEFRKDLNCQLLPFHNRIKNQNQTITDNNNDEKDNYKDRQIIIFDKLTHLILNRVWELTCDWGQWYVHVCV